jgi:hypothetical protein
MATRLGGTSRLSNACFRTTSACSFLQITPQHGRSQTIVISTNESTGQLINLARNTDVEGAELVQEPASVQVQESASVQESAPLSPPATGQPGTGVTRADCVPEPALFPELDSGSVVAPDTNSKFKQELAEFGQELFSGFLAVMVFQIVQS